jgi:hypothetical protein
LKTLWILIAPIACSEPLAPFGPSTSDAAIEDASLEDATPPDAAPDASLDAGARWEIELEVLRDQNPVRLYVPVVYEAQEGWFILDTGSQVTFVPLGPDDPDYVPSYATIELGGRMVSIAGRRLELVEEHQGIPILGILGNDVMLASPWELDLPGGRLVEVQDTTPYDDWTRLAFENVYDFMFARATVDGVEVRMGVDTGATHLLWLGMDGEPGDVPQPTQDALGNPVTLYLGTASLLMGGEPERIIPVWRTLSFPAIEMSNMQIGGQIDGIIGLSTLGDRRLLLNGPQDELRLDPF